MLHRGAAALYRINRAKRDGFHESSQGRRISARAPRLRAAARSTGSVAQKDLLDRQAEHVGDTERQRQRRIVLSGLDRIHALPRYLERVGKLLLAPLAFGAQHAQAVLHRLGTVVQVRLIAPRLTSIPPTIHGSGGSTAPP